MKILILTKYDNHKNDATVGTYNNVFKCLSNCFGSNNIDVFQFPKPSAYTFVKSLIFRTPFCETWQVRREMKRIACEKYDFVFCMSSLFLEYIHKFFRSQKTIVYFQNIEQKYYRDKFEITRTLGNKKLYSYITRIESNITELNSKIIVLNERDNGELLKLYGKKADLVLPISFSKIDQTYLKSLITNNDEKYVLFLGSNFYANQQGIKWFLDNVSPYIRFKVYVVGDCCNYIRQFNYDESKVILLGYVEDFAKTMVNASAVVCPIFSGSGMKTKTIEALRYGKIVFGTNEAFAGIYETADGLFLCNQANEFIIGLEKLFDSTEDSKFNSSSYNLFMENYSFEAFEETLSNFMKELH